MGAIANLAREHGSNNIVFFMPARPLGVSWDDFWVKEYPQEIKEFRADESDSFRSLTRNHKMILSCIEPNYHKEEFYISDFESLCKENPDRFRFTLTE